MGEEAVGWLERWKERKRKESEDKKEGNLLGEKIPTLPTSECIYNKGYWKFEINFEMEEWLVARVLHREVEIV